MTKEIKDITIKHLEDTIIFLIRTLHKDIYNNCILVMNTQSKNYVNSAHLILTYLQIYLGYIVTIINKVYIGELNKVTTPKKYFNFIYYSNITSLEDKRLSIEIPYKETLQYLYKDIEGKILDKYITEQMLQHGKE